MDTMQSWIGALLFFVTLPFLFIGKILGNRNKREYALSHEDRTYEIRRKFGEPNMTFVKSMLSKIVEPTDQVLGAIIFLANNVDQLSDLVELANTDKVRLLNAATVKDERG
jgi:hypothetical protein